MSQTVMLDRRQSDPRHHLDTNAGEFVAPVPGDFARGQRHVVPAAHAYADFATGMRTASISRVTGDFATGMRTSPRTMTLGDFAAGMRTSSEPLVRHRFRKPVTALPAAA